VCLHSNAWQCAHQLLNIDMRVSRTWLGGDKVGCHLCLLLYMQDKCSFLQVNRSASSVRGASVSVVRCKGHQGVMKMVSAPEFNRKAVKCTNCSGCKGCRQPVPLVIPEGTGGSGCSAEVAAKAAALHAALHKSSEAASVGNVAAGGGTQSSTAANPALVECGVCRRKPGDPGVPATLKLCGGCQVTRYCSAECQRKDWKMGHKGLCERLAEVTLKSGRH
jgi:hypothetical protein